MISGQALPKPPGGSKTGEVIDPYVVINTYGRPEDQHMFKTKTVQDNGGCGLSQSLSLHEQAMDTRVVQEMYSNDNCCLIVCSRFQSDMEPEFLVRGPCSGLHLHQVQGDG